jgi:hypothetical protein
VVIEERRIEIDALTVGMFVSRLQVPWAQTDFPLEGCLIESSSDVDWLRRYGQHVWIDIRKTFVRDADGLLTRLGYGSNRPRRPPLPKPVTHPRAVPLNEELPRADRDWRNFAGAVRAARRTRELER